ncbi:MULTISPECIES: GIY-YIG nuclease family protein [unclassified Brevundimonas]|uniref:GIY-YIG nuclease family protein n=1 Tax=unclassified Brevundimonas TaxID=2622653 RepID=UPI003F8DEEF3
MARLTDDSFIATYIIASGRNGTLYTGVSSDLPARVAQHKQELRPGFTSAYGCKRLVWFERYTFITEAIRRERAIKTWLRDWKLKLIEDLNPDWRDLSEGWFE